LTIGFWSNKNWLKVMQNTSNELGFLVGLNLKNANGSNFDPSTLSAFQTWLLNANATNMAYMLSAQLAGMELNVQHGYVSGTVLVYAPCLLNSSFPASGVNTLGFISISDLMAAANTELGLHGNTLSGSPYRAYQECLKNALDDANNNKNFVQDSPCALPDFN
jgi:hypothetical protein